VNLMYVCPCIVV